MEMNMGLKLLDRGVAVEDVEDVCFDTDILGEEMIVEDNGSFAITATEGRVQIGDTGVYAGFGNGCNIIDGEPEPDFGVTVLFDGNGNVLYWEQDGLEVTLHNYFGHRFQGKCWFVMPRQAADTAEKAS